MENLFKLTKTKFILATLLVFIVCFWSGCVETIDAGHTGILFHKWSSDDAKHGSVESTVKGWVVYNGFTSSIYQYPTFIQRKTYDAISVNAKDASIFKITPTIAYRLNPDKITNIFVKYRKKLGEIEEGYIFTAIYEAYRTIGNQYSSDYLMSNRGEFEAQVRLRLDQTLGVEGFIVEEFTAQIEPPESLRMAIDEKNKAVQDVLKAENEVARAEANAKITIAQAKGEAEALKIKADGEAYYNKTVAASLSALLIQQDAVGKWDGKLPQYNGSNAPLPFLNIGSNK